MPTKYKRLNSATAHTHTHTSLDSVLDGRGGPPREGFPPGGGGRGLDVMEPEDLVGGGGGCLGLCEGGRRGEEEYCGSDYML